MRAALVALRRLLGDALEREEWGMVAAIERFIMDTLNANPYE